MFKKDLLCTILDIASGFVRVVYLLIEPNRNILNKTANKCKEVFNPDWGVSKIKLFKQKKKHNEVLSPL